MADAVSIEKIVIEAEGMTLSRLIWRRFRTRKNGYLERVLAINPGVAKSPYLPVGTVVSLPIGEDAEKPKRAEAVRLWS